MYGERTITQVETILPKIQSALGEENLDGWLLYDFQGSNPIARRIIRLGRRILTRRLFYYIPAKGSPTAVIPEIEAENLSYLPGRKLIYKSWPSLHKALQTALEGAEVIAMEYSPENDIPDVSMVDAGTFELVRKFGVEIVSSGDLVQLFEARWNMHQYVSHIESAKKITQIKDAGIAFLVQELKQGNRVSEYDLQQFFWRQYEENELVVDEPPMVAANKNTTQRHYQAQPDSAAILKTGDLVFINLEAKLKKRNAVYCDITCLCYIGTKVPDEYSKVFDIVKGAQQASFHLIVNNYENRKTTYGWQADDAAREYIAARGYGGNFEHRTGHSLGQDVFGKGAHLDNFETREHRKLVPFTAFTISPGIYTPEFGITTSLNVFIGEHGPEITAPDEQKIHAILA